MDRGMPPWRALLRGDRQHRVREDVRVDQAPRIDQATASCAASSPPSVRRRQGRKHGWKHTRRFVRVAGPVPVFEDDLEDAVCPPSYYDEWDRMFPSCVADCGCHDDPEWWVQVTPEHLYLHNGLVHIAMAGCAYSYCGKLVWGHIDPPTSTDRVKHIIERRRKLHTVTTCLECSVESWTYGDR